MFLYCLLAVSPVVDIVSDLLTAANFAWCGHPRWAIATLVVVYMSGRFTLVLMALRPELSFRSLVCLYVPGCWVLANIFETPSACVEEDASVGAGGGASGAEASSPLDNPQTPGESSPEDAALEDPRIPGGGTQPRPGEEPTP